MKTIKIPEFAIELPKALDSTEQTSFGLREFMIWLLNVDATLNKADRQTLRAATAIEDAVELSKLEPKEGETATIVLEDAHWKLVLDAASEPSVGQYPINPPRRCSPWIEAIAAAT